MTTLILFCGRCGSPDVQNRGYDDSETEIWQCELCGQIQSRQELDEERVSSSDEIDFGFIDQNEDE